MEYPSLSKLQGLSALGLILALNACSIGEQPAFDEEAPFVQVLSPLENARFAKGSAVPITIGLSDNLGLHAYYIYMMDEGAGLPSLVEKRHIHASRWTVEQQFSIPQDATGPFRLDVEATDHEYNTTRVAVPIIVE